MSSLPVDRFDLAVIGGGIVGLATAYRYLQRSPDRSLVLLEKEVAVAEHQTGHNSGVLHSGIYYKPGSLKARNCRAGKRAMEEFCSAESIPFDICGKVIVALDESELPRLNTIFERGQANGVQCEMIGVDRLRELEPHAAGIAAIHVPEAGIVDYRQVCERLAQRVREAGGEIRLGAKVDAVQVESPGARVRAGGAEVLAARVVNCAGLHCDRVAKLGGARPSVKIIPFRGEYFELKPVARGLVNNLIYPTPDPAFPFLGVHFTRMIHGGVECGPNAVLALGREGYAKTSLNVRDLAESLSYGGFLRMAAKYWRTGAGEMWRSASKRAFTRALQRLLPEIAASDLEAAPAGIRAQAVARDGLLVDDFLIEPHGPVVNVLNAPSPAATSALEIGRVVVEQLDQA